MEKVLIFYCQCHNCPFKFQKTSRNWCGWIILIPWCSVKILPKLIHWPTTYIMFHWMVKECWFNLQCSCVNTHYLTIIHHNFPIDILFLAGLNITTDGVQAPTLHGEITNLFPSRSRPRRSVDCPDLGIGARNQLKINGISWRYMMFLNVYTGYV